MGSRLRAVYLDRHSCEMAQVSIHCLSSSHAQENPSKHDPSHVAMVYQKLEGPVWRHSREDSCMAVAAFSIRQSDSRRADL